MRHSAHDYSFDDLLAGLGGQVEAGNIMVQTDGDLRLYCYTKQCTYERAWNVWTKMARGLILDVFNRRIVATPFEKFFNWGESEGGEDLPFYPNLPFESYEKLDGSLLIVFYYMGKWRTATKGSFNSTQAQWGQEQIASSGLIKYLSPGVTYLFEAIYNENRIVIRYPYEGLVSLGAYAPNGYEWILTGFENIPGIRMAKRYFFGSISEMLYKAKHLKASEEGWVVRFSNGQRVKIKGDEYKRIHAMVSRMTPLSIWESMKNGGDLGAIRKDLPEEFWADFDSIVDAIWIQASMLISTVATAEKELKHLGNKELVLSGELNKWADYVRKLIFTYRKNRDTFLVDNKARTCIFGLIRPTGNVLVNYTPSFGIQRVLEDS